MSRSTRTLDIRIAYWTGDRKTEAANGGKEHRIILSTVSSAELGI